MSPTYYFINDTPVFDAVTFKGVGRGRPSKLPGFEWSTKPPCIIAKGNTKRRLVLPNLKRGTDAHTPLQA